LQLLNLLQGRSGRKRACSRLWVSRGWLEEQPQLQQAARAFSADSILPTKPWQLSDRSWLNEEKKYPRVLIASLDMLWSEIFLSKFG
jgi:hypothetical protein